VLDLLRGDPELLAIADAIASTQAGGSRLALSDLALHRWLHGSITARMVRTVGRRAHRG
jgi:hypothetical protein